MDENLAMIIDSKTRVEILEDRFDRHLTEIRDSIKELSGEVKKIGIYTNELEKNQIKQESQLWRKVAEHGGSGFVGGGILTAIVELIKMLRHP